jgi:adenylate kinase family enzyme
VKNLNRIVVIGTSSSGKTTLAKELGHLLKIEHRELDYFFWKPGWQESSVEEFRQKVDAFTKETKWITDGNFSQVRDIVWSRATHVIWLDYSLKLILSQFFKRSMMRSWKKEVLWGTNQESLWNSILKPNSLLVWILKTYKRNKVRYQELIVSDSFKGVTFIKLSHPRETQDFIKKINLK